MNPIDTGFYYDDEEKKKLVGAGITEETQDLAQPGTLLPFEEGGAPGYSQEQFETEQANDRSAAQALKQEKSGDFDGRPIVADNLGDAFTDLTGGVVNAGLSLVTDYADLAAGLVDVGRETVSLATGNGFNEGGDKIFNDRDNPWTEWRVDTFRSSSKLGQTYNHILRVGAGLFAFKKYFAQAAIVGPIKFAGAVSKSKKIAGAAKLAQKGDDLIQGGTKGTRFIQRGLKLSSAKKFPDSKLVGLTQADSWLLMTYKDLANSGKVAKEGLNLFRATEKTAKGLTKGKAAVRTVGEFILWDAFVNFNAMGEGDALMDDTLTDTFKDIGLPYIPFFESRVEDTSLQAKLRGTIEGSIFGAFLGATTDVFRVFRWSRAFSKAGPEEQAEIVRQLNRQGNYLGRSINELEELGEKIAKSGRVRAEGVKSGAVKTGAQGRQARVPLDDAGNLVDPGLMGPKSAQESDRYLLLDQALNGVQRGREQNALSENVANNLYNYQQAQATNEAGTLVRQADSFIDPDNPVSPGGVRQIQQPDVPERGLDTTFDGSTYRGVRPPEPTVSPQTIREGFEQYIKEGLGDMGPGIVDDLLNKTMQLLPRKRVDVVNYLQQFPRQFNEAGMLPAADQKVSDYIFELGRSEGWISIGDDLVPRFNRKLAYDLDRGNLAQLKADAADEAAELERYVNRSYESVADTERYNQRIRPGVQAGDDVRAKQAYDAADFDDFERNQDLPASFGTPDPNRPQGPLPEVDVPNAEKVALTEARRRESLAGVKGDAMKNMEAQELEAARLRAQVEGEARMGMRGDDNKVVMEMMDADLDNLPPLEIGGAKGKYQILDQNGVSIDGRTYGNLRTARKGLEVALKQQRDDYISTARAAMARGEDQSISATMGVDITDSPNVRADLSLTRPQQALLNKLGLELDGTKLNLSQQELSGMMNSLEQLAETASGSEKRVINNIMNKVNEQVIDLKPMARRAAITDKTLKTAQKFRQQGEFCN